jgi:carboxyl-terminal processing protease
MKLRTLLLSLSASAAVAGAVYAQEMSDRTFEYLNLFGDVFERVRTDYVEEVDDGELIENALNGMLSSLDPHSSYLSEKSFKDMQIQTKGEFGGLGIEVTMESGLVKVVSPIDDTPASKAGVKAGDYISSIDGEAVMGLSLSEAVDKMRGKVGSEIKITILREGLDEPLELTLIRDVIKIHTVKSKEEKDIGILRVTSFSEQTFDKLSAEIAKMRRDMPDLKGIVLDLRNNPGGLLDQAVAVSDAFLEHGEVVSTRGRRPEDIRRYSASPGDLLDGLPMVVLINSGSASAAEIVAGALQDHQRAVVMGVKSFGKGSVQTVIPMPGHGAMRLTTSRYYTPSGRSIQAEGIEPNIEVPEAKIELVNNGKDRHEADLRGALKNDNKAIEEILKKAQKPADDSKAEEEAKKTAKPGEMDPADDYQLARAIDLLRGLAIYHKPASASAVSSTETEAPTIEPSKAKP